MALNPFAKKAPAAPFSSEDQALITAAIAAAEQRTSGEVRVFVEEKCKYVDALHRAEELFVQLKMHNTRERNACLVYVALTDHQLAVFADAGIYTKVEQAFWNQLVRKMIADFNKDNHAKGIAEVVLKIGEALTEHFPYDGSTDKNELPNDIVFG